MDQTLQSSSEETTATNQYVTVGVLASVTASLCCIGPFALLATGLSGAWMSRVMLVEPFQPFLVALTVLMFFLAARKIFNSAREGRGEASCPASGGRRQKLVFSLAAGLALTLVTSEYWIPLVAAWLSVS